MRRLLRPMSQRHRTPCVRAAEWRTGALWCATSRAVAAARGGQCSYGLRLTLFHLSIVVGLEFYQRPIDVLVLVGVLVAQQNWRKDNEWCSAHERGCAAHTTDTYSDAGRRRRPVVRRRPASPLEVPADAQSSVPHERERRHSAQRRTNTFHSSSSLLICCVLIWLWRQWRAQHRRTRVIVCTNRGPNDCCSTQRTVRAAAPRRWARARATAKSCDLR